VLVGTRPCSYEQHGPVGKFQPPGERLGDKVCLVIPTFAFPLPVERNGHDHIGRECFAPDQVSKPFREPFPQRLHALELEKEKRSHQHALIRGVIPGEVKAVEALFLPRARPA